MVTKQIEIDLMTRLRSCAECEQAPLGPLLTDAADEIERLRVALGSTLKKRENDLMEALNALGQIMTMADRAIGLDAAEQDNYLAKISDLARKVAVR